MGGGGDEGDAEEGKAKEAGRLRREEGTYAWEQVGKERKNRSC